MQTGSTGAPALRTSNSGKYKSVKTPLMYALSFNSEVGSRSTRGLDVSDYLSPRMSKRDGRVLLKFDRY